MKKFNGRGASGEEVATQHKPKMRASIGGHFSNSLHDLERIAPHLTESIVTKTVRAVMVDVNHELIKLMEQMFLTMHPLAQMPEIGIPSKDGLDLISMKDIIRLESKDSYTYFYLDDGSHKMSCKPLTYYLPHLGTCFFQVSRAHIVCLSKIRSIRDIKDGTIKMKDNKTIEVARNRLKELRARISYVS